MPKLYDYLGFVFYFYSNEHLPVHCHVVKGNYQVKAELIFVGKKLDCVKFKRIGKYKMFGADDLNLIEVFMRKHHQEIVDKWNNYFIYNIKPKFEKIIKK